jgi:hypothetical protein
VSAQPTPAVPAHLSPCGTLALVACCPVCGAQHVHGWSGDTGFDARPRRPACDAAAAPYAITPREPPS